MPHPKHRRTSSSKKRRASHFALKTQDLAECLECKAPVRSHHACAACGAYGAPKKS